MTSISDSKVIISNKNQNLITHFFELGKYLDLFKFLILRDIKVLYRQTVLGFLWAVIRPVVTMIIFSFIFGNLAQIRSDNIPYPIFNYTALIPWFYFSNVLNKTTTSLISNARLFSKVYFPRIILPLTSIFSSLVDFLLSFLVLILLMIYYSVIPSINIIYLPILIFIMMLTASGIGLWLSALAIQYRDIPHALPFLSQILMYAAPIVWPISLFQEKFGESMTLLYGLYPMVGVIEGFRAILLNTEFIPWELISISFITSMILFITGSLYFNYKERIFADVV